jgi:glycosyltransferase involved in cell wall biosynthesis
VLPASLEDRVVLVTTSGEGSMDAYGALLAAHLSVDRMDTEVGRVSAELFGVPALSRRALRAVRADMRFVRALRARPPALWHFTNHHTLRYAPLARAPYVATVHDVIRQSDARDGTSYISPPNARDRGLLRLDAVGIRRAAAVIAPSRATKNALVRRLDLDPARVAVVHHGVDHRLFRPVARRLVDGPYLLYVGSDHPRKDLPTLLRAFATLKRDPRHADLRLVKVGDAGRPEGGFGADTKALVAALGIARDAVFTGRVPDADLPAYYTHATCLVLPSLAEGFGLPVLEAMACGTPPVVSSAGSLPEVAGYAGVVVAPRDARALHRALAELLADPLAQRELARRALARGRRFSWARAAAATVRVYAAVRDAGRPGDVEPRESEFEDRRSRSPGESRFASGEPAVARVVGRPSGSPRC